MPVPELYKQQLKVWAKRRRKIVARVKKGESLADIARDLKISRQRVKQLYDYENKD